MGNAYGGVPGSIGFLGGCEEDFDVQPLKANPIVEKIKAQEEKKARKSKANDFHQNFVSQNREFELLRMKDSETTKVYSDRLLNIAKIVRLRGSEFADTRIVEKILVTVPEIAKLKRQSLHWRIPRIYQNFR